MTRRVVERHERGHLVAEVGINIGRAAKDAVEIAKESGNAEVLVFNDIRVGVSGDIPPGEVETRYHHASELRRVGKWDARRISM